jgi:hypothetical protein
VQAVLATALAEQTLSPTKGQAIRLPAKEFRSKITAINLVGQVEALRELMLIFQDCGSPKLQPTVKSIT